MLKRRKMEGNSDARLTNFLRSLADSVEKKNLDKTRMKSISEFYMRYKWEEELSNDTNNSNNSKISTLGSQESEKESEEDNIGYREILKYAILGWYVYRHIL